MRSTFLWGFARKLQRPWRLSVLLLGISASFVLAASAQEPNPEKNAPIPPAASLSGQPPVASPSAIPTPATSDQSRAKVSCPTPDELKNLYRTLSSIEVKAAPSSGQLPIDCSDRLFAKPADPSAAGNTSRAWGQIEYQWRPTELAHQPLYFDDVPLERYGQTVSPALQPVISGARFFGTLPILPYKTGLNGPWERVSTLGYYRPGSPAPCVRQTVPLEFDAAFIESGAWVGMIFLLP